MREHSKTTIETFKGSRSEITLFLLEYDQGMEDDTYILEHKKVNAKVIDVYTSKDKFEIDKALDRLRKYELNNTLERLKKVCLYHNSHPNDQLRKRLSELADDIDLFTSHEVPQLDGSEEKLYGHQ